MNTTVFNPIQQHLLQMFSRLSSEEELKEVQQVLAEYYFKKVEKRAAEIYHEKGWSPDTLEVMSHQHFRTPYQYQ